jgi:uncharacterized membrane protein
MLLSWVHLLAVTVYLGSVVGLGLILLPALGVIKNHEAQVNLLARGLKFYNPLQSGALGILVISGALQVTELKAVYRELFLKELGLRLGLKLTLSFVLILLSAYQSMAVAHRFVRRHESGELLSYRDLQSTLQRLRTSTLALLVLALATALVSIALQQR